MVVAEESNRYPDLDADESYQLTVTDDGILLKASNDVGALRGLQTLRQLVTEREGTLQLPTVTIDDSPQWAWRGMVLDTARHFMPVSTVKRLLAGMEMVKLNVLHLHLSDDQGFRAESRVLPKLHEVGSGGDYYTQSEITELVEYAADRGIRIVPEFGLPGHSLSWQVAYPELRVDGLPDPVLGEWSSSLFSPPINPAKEKSYELINLLVAEMASLFPDHYFHIGSDEVNTAPWKSDSSIRDFMKAKGLRSVDALHSYFAQRYASMVAAHGKLPIAWEEAVHPEDTAEPLPFAVQLWLDGDYPPAFASADILMSRNYYLDHQQPAWWLYQQKLTDFEVEGISDVAEQGAPRILGAEIAAWSEHVDHDTLDIAVWPRSAALAERFWSQPSQLSKGAVTFYRRLDVVSERLVRLGMRHKEATENYLAEISERDLEALTTFVDALEPAGYYYQRSRKRLLRFVASAIFPFVEPPAYALGDVDRLIDHLPAESQAARQFAIKTERLLSGDNRVYPELREQLLTWEASHDRLAPLIEQSDALRRDELQFVTKTVSEIAAIGLRALDSLAKGEPLGFIEYYRLSNRLDDFEYGVFSFDNYGEMANGVFRPDPLQQHNIAIQPAVARLVYAARNQAANVQAE